MSMKYLGRHFDIHGGGLDLVFPHHENELVQSESYTGETFATYWLHNGLLTKDGRKISKSDPGTIVLMSDLLKAHDADTLARLALSSHYRRPIDFGPGRLDEIERSLQTFYRAFERFAELTGERFDQLAAPTAPRRARSRRLAAAQGNRRAPPAVPRRHGRRLQHRRGDRRALRNRPCAEPVRQSLPPAPERRSAGQLAEYSAGMIVLKELSQILGLFQQAREQPPSPADHALSDGLMGLLIDLRARLRKEKNFALADEVRNRLSELGVTLEDRPDGTRWRGRADSADQTVTLRMLH